MKSKWFRKMLAGALSAALCCGMLTGCGKGVEQTNEELNIYISEGNVTSINYPLELFKQKYPDVKVNLTIISNDAEDVLYSTLQTGLMTGKNVADIMIIDSALTEHSDIYKTERSGAFIDLNTLFEQDESFDASLYYTPIVEGLEYDGHQYIYPITFRLPYVFSTEEKLAELGISMEEFQSMTILDFFRFIKQKQAESGMEVEQIVSGNLDLGSANSVYFRWYFPDVVDYEKDSFSFDTEEMRELIEDMEITQDFENSAMNMDGYLYAAPRMGQTSGQMYTEQMLYEGETAVLTCLKDKSGNINADICLAAAIPQLSPNQQNAYQFLKMILSEKVQNLKAKGPGEDDKLAIGFTPYDTAVMRRASHLWTWGQYAGEDYASIRESDYAYCAQASGSFLYSEWSKLIMEQAEEYYKGNCSAEQAVESVEKKLKIYVSE